MSRKETVKVTEMTITLKVRLSVFEDREYGPWVGEAYVLGARLTQVLGYKSKGKALKALRKDLEKMQAGGDA